VLDGIGQQTIWGDVKGQSTLGDGNFVARLVDYVKGHNQVKEFPRSLRHMNRPTLEEIFRNTKERREKRNNGIFRAIELWGYSQREVADYLGFHYSTVSRLLKQFKLGMSKLKT
jgi:DNA-directed RNA polymerase specialized sigma24 family protein